MYEEIMEIAKIANNIIETKDNKYSDITHIYTVAHGSSAAAAKYVETIFNNIHGIPATSILPGTILPTVTNYASNTLVIAFSQSGRSIDIHDTMRSCKMNGMKTLAFINDPFSPLCEICDEVIFIGAGNEVAVPATKTCIITMLRGLEFAAQFDKELMHYRRALGNELVHTLNAGPTTLLDGLSNYNQVYVVGKNFNLPIAHELALKLQECCHIFGIAYSDNQIMHGPITLLNPKLPVIMLHDNPNLENIISDRGCSLYKISIGYNSVIDPVVKLVQLYLEIEAMSRRMGFNPDEPANLSKVTITQ